MKKNIFTVKIEVKRFYTLEYVPETKSVKPILVDFMYENEKHSASLYRIFDTKEEAKIFFDLFCFFMTSSEIEISINKEIINEEDTIVGSKEIASFLLVNEDTPEEEITAFLNTVDWDTNVELYSYLKN